MRLAATELERSVWKTAVALPQSLEERRMVYLSRRTGPQLRRACEQYAAGKVSEPEDAMMRVWLDLAQRYAICKPLVDRLKTTPSKILAIGDGTAITAACRERWTDAEITAVEATEARMEALMDVAGSQGVECTRSLVDVARRGIGRYDLVVAGWHLGELQHKKPCDAALALLWGCVKTGGMFAVVEDATNERLIQTARSRMLDPKSHGDPSQTASVIMPCPSNLRCPLLKLPISLPSQDADLIQWPSRETCTFPQMVSPPVRGPALRSLNAKNAGTVITTRNSIVRYSYIVFQKGVSKTSLKARVLGTPIKNPGHVIVDFCTPDAKKERLTFSKSQDSKFNPRFTYRDARKVTWGSAIAFDPDKYPITASSSESSSSSSSSSSAASDDSLVLPAPPLEDSSDDDDPIEDEDHRPPMVDEDLLDDDDETMEEEIASYKYYK